MTDEDKRHGALEANSAPIVTLAAEDVYQFLVNRGMDEAEALRRAEAVSNEAIEAMAWHMFDWMFNSDTFCDALEEAMERQGML